MVMMRPWVRISRLGFLLGAVVLSMSPSLAAGEQAAAAPARGDVLVRVMALDVTVARIDSTIPSVGGKVDTPDKLVPGADLSYFIADHWAVEGQGGPFVRVYRVRQSLIGDFDVGRIHTRAVSLVLQYHLRPSAKLKPYLGLGLNYAWSGDVEPAAGIPDFKVSDITSGIASLGGDYRVTDRWFLSGSVRYLLSPTYQFRGHGFNATVKLDTLVVGAGIGYRF
ncbi:OmpW/AlkL family protein [Xanthomonas arboricola]|uniref:OmpW/AlkL family protein n=1 Tax=Xanthomonas arboricola TaxID=56448 RepID=UPI000CEE718C|nr:OmpW family outer membrane protein [Xanthomonas arboricola]PPT47860.1 hypothetical protein XarbCFBP8147_16660 [Xanthomonas arboricola]